MRLLSRGLGIHAVVAIAILMACLIVCLTPTAAFAQNNSIYANAPTIFDVRRSLPLDPDEEVTHDFYINAGPEAGLKKGVFISVVRPVPVHDPIQNKQQATLNIPIGKLQIIHVEKNISVGRLQNELSDDERPTVEFEAIMIGDRVDLASMTSESAAKKPKSRKQSAKTSDGPASAAAELPPESQRTQPSSIQLAPPTGLPTPGALPAVAPVNSPSVAPAAPSTGAPNSTPKPAPSSAEREEPPSPRPLRKNPFEVAIAPDMLRVDDGTNQYPVEP